MTSDVWATDPRDTPSEVSAIAITQRRWGFMEDGVFVSVPRLPIERADLTPPCDIMLMSGMRHIIEEPTSEVIGNE